MNPCNLIRFGWNKVLDWVFGPSEDFTYESTTSWKDEDVGT